MRRAQLTVAAVAHLLARLCEEHHSQIMDRNLQVHFVPTDRCRMVITADSGHIRY